MTTSTWTGGAPQLRRRRERIVGVTIVLLLAVAAAIIMTGVRQLVSSADSGAAGAPDGGAVPVSDAGEQPAEDPVDDGASPSEPPAGEPAPGDLADPADPADPVDPGAPVADEGSGDEGRPDGAGGPDEDDAPDEGGDPGQVEESGDGAGAGDGEDEDSDEEEDPGELELRVSEVQDRLRELGYLIGPADGRLGQQTRTAVMAFQRVHGLQVDGIVGPVTTEALLGSPVAPELRGGPDDRIEVDLTNQLLHLIEGGERIVTLAVSSGNGETYPRLDGSTSRAVTPVGDFVIERRIRGARESSAGLGTLFDPLYFHRGFAIHGSNSVPAWPASHGCVRISRADAVWLFDRVPDGLPVHLYGGTHVYSPR